MDVEDHFKLQKHEELTTAFRYRDPKTNVRNFADSFFRALLDLFDKELKPVVDRGLFEETPVDWMGYR
jgi:hypothetical protein